MVIIKEKVSLLVDDGTKMTAFVARPDDNKTYPGLLLFQEAFGVNDHIRNVAERLAGEGYVVIAPELFHRTGEGVEIAYDSSEKAGPHREGLTDENILADAKAGYQWLEKEIGKNNDIGSIGFCMGGRISFLANANLPLKASISFYGGNIAPSLLPQVESLNGPMLFFWGGLDQHIDRTQRQNIFTALDTAKKSYINVEFSDAGHGFFCDKRERSYNPKAARQAWPLTLEFFKTYLS